MFGVHFSYSVALRTPPVPSGPGSSGSDHPSAGKWASTCPSWSDTQTLRPHPSVGARKTPNTGQHRRSPPRRFRDGWSTRHTCYRLSHDTPPDSPLPTPRRQRQDHSSPPGTSRPHDPSEYLDEGCTVDGRRLPGRYRADTALSGGGRGKRGCTVPSPLRDTRLTTLSAGTRLWSPAPALGEKFS